MKSIRESVYFPLMVISKVAGPQVKASLSRQSPLPYSAVEPEISNPFHPTASRVFKQQLEKEMRSRRRRRRW